jgi:phage gp45-like
MIQRILNLARIGRTKIVDDTGPVQRVQVFEGDLGAYGGPRTIDNVAKVGHFGLISVPPLDSELILLAPGGNRSQTIAIGSNHQPSRVKDLQPGDAGLHDVRGAKMTLTVEGVVIDAAGGPVVVKNFSSCTVMGDLHVTGDVISRSDGAAVSLNGLRDAYDAHKHPGVTAGGASTATTDHPA